jgi:hypothetical protein
MTLGVSTMDAEALLATADAASLESGSAAGQSVLASGVALGAAVHTPAEHAMTSPRAQGQ